MFYTYNFCSKKEKKFLSNNNLVCPFSWPQIFLYKKICKKWNFLSTNNLLWMFRDVFLFCIWQLNFCEACFDHPQGKGMFNIYIYIYIYIGWIIHLQIFPYEWVPLLTIRECWKHGKINFQNWHFLTVDNTI